MGWSKLLELAWFVMTVVVGYVGMLIKVESSEKWLTVSEKHMLIELVSSSY